MTTLIKFLNKRLNFSFPIWIVLIICTGIAVYTGSLILTINHYRNQNITTKVRMERSTESLRRINDILDAKLTNDGEVSDDIRSTLDLLIRP